MTEMALTKKRRIKKNQGGGTGPLPFKRKFERERIEGKGKYPKEVIVNPNDPRLVRLAEMDREIAAQDKGGRVTPEMMRGLERQLEDLERERLADRQQFLTERDQHIAGELDRKAQQLMRSNPEMDYGSAVRIAVGESDHFTSGDAAPAPRIGRVYGNEAELREAVERRMASDPEHYPDEDDEPVGSVHDMDPGAYAQQVREAAKARGYDI